MQRRWAALALTVIALTTGCKSVDEYLLDLDTTVPGEPESFDVEEAALLFDPGQLGHEALTGLAKAEEMTFAQAMRSLFHGCNYLAQARDNILLQGDAAVLIGHLASRIPVRPIGMTLEEHDDESIVERIYPSIEILLEARTVFTIEAEIENLTSPDAVGARDAYRALREMTGKDLGRDPVKWKEWFETERPGMIEEFLEKSREPFEIIGRTKFSGGEAVALLGVLSTWINLYARPELREVYAPATLNLARQAAVGALTQAMSRHRQPIVREDVAAAMGKIRDPSFGESLITQLGRERDSNAASKIIRALEHYPSRETVTAIINSMALDLPQVNQNAADVLSLLTGNDLGPEEKAWVAWWNEEGEQTWP